MPIKLLVISNYRSTTTVRPEAEILVGLAQQGFEVTVMTYQDSPYCARFYEVGIRVIDFHPKKKFNLKEIRFVRAELIQGQYDILYLFNNKGISTGLLASIGLPVKVVLYRGYTGNTHWYDPTAYLKHLSPRVDKIVCNAKGVEEDLQKQLFFDKSKTITINKGHELSWYANVKPIDRAELGLRNDDFVLACVANVRPMKGIPYLLESAKYWPKGAPIHLLLLGNGMDTPSNLKLVQQAVHPENIHFLGFRKDPLSIVAASNAFILPSIKGEAITKAVLEAMSLGIGPIITDIAGNRELVVPNETGIVVPKKNAKALAEAVSTLYSQPGLCQKYGQGAQQRIDNVLNSRNTVAQTKVFFEELVGKKG